MIRSRLLRNFLALLILLTAPVQAEDFAGRTYVITDARATADPAPLVILLHGLGGTGRHLRRTSGFDDFAARRNLVAVYPSAPDRRWNDGRWGALDRPDIEARDDVGWIAGLIADLAARGIADPGQVHVIGHSNGGGMAVRIACDRPDILRGIAIVASKMLTDFACQATTPLPAILFYGTDDQIAPHGGRDESLKTVFDTPLGNTLSADATLALWRGRNRCGPAGPVQRSDPDPTDGVTLAVTDWTGCAAPLRYVEMTGGGHAFPGAPGPLLPGLRSLIGDPIRDVNAGEAALAFWFGD